ncbi:hypothetical protein ACJ5H2_13535 [Nocardioides sp. R1-1]|uniref:hypothetical protein n=1 Tax=Nocardioides sp. R1-1 TaxID=3383502 RepID=UPI0038D0A64F
MRPNQYEQEFHLQQAALQELRDHAHRLMGGLPWITDDVAEVVASINELAEG